MNKEEFISELRQRLEVFPEAEAEEYINYYREMIEDRLEENADEEAVVADLGSVDDVFASILQETALTRLMKNKMKPKQKRKPWEITLWIVGFPLWFPLGIALAATCFSLLLTLYVLLWTLVLVLYAVELALAVCAVIGPIASVLHLVEGNGYAGGALLAAGLVCAGSAMILFHPCLLAAVGMGRLSRRIWLGVKFLIVRKDKRK